MRPLALVLTGLLLAPALGAQEGTIQRAAQAYENLDYAGAIRLARQALRTGGLPGDAQAQAWEILGFSLGALDSTRQAVEAFRELIFLDPNREPDPNVVSPRITSLYASALGQVLVVRSATVDSVSFIAGRGVVPVRFQVSRPARVVVRAVGQGLDLLVDSLLVSGTTRVDWVAMTLDADPVPEGAYQIIITASEGSTEFATPVGAVVTHGDVDTLSHLTSLPGYTPLLESVRPPRNWKPLGIAVLLTGAAAGASLALENTALGGGERREIGGVAVATLLVGLVASLTRPGPEPVEANIRYNQLLQDQLAARNAELAAENVERRRQVQLTVIEADR